MRYVKRNVRPFATLGLQWSHCVLPDHRSPPPPATLTLENANLLIDRAVPSSRERHNYRNSFEVSWHPTNMWISLLDSLRSQTETIGFWAGSLTTIAFAPQLVKAWRTRGPRAFLGDAGAVRNRRVAMVPLRTAANVRPDHARQRCHRHTGSRHLGDKNPPWLCQPSSYVR